MEALLDTTIIIERIFKRKYKEAIGDLIKKCDCGISTYVLGEFKSNIVKDFVTLYNIMLVEESLDGVRDSINDNVFYRSYQRVYYVYNDLCKMYNNNYQLIKVELETYGDRLERRAKVGLSLNMLNETECHRAEAEVVCKEGKMKILGVNCTKEDTFCNRCAFWDKVKAIVYDLEKEKGIPSKMKEPLKKLNQENEIPAGNACRSLGDCIIALEALETTQKKVYTTNVKDFKPICDYIGVEVGEINCNKI